MGQALVKTYSATTTGALEKLSAPGAAPFATYAFSVKGVGGAATSWTVLLEGSLDGVNWSTIATHNATDGSIVWETSGKAAMHVRPNVSALSLGGSATAIAVTVVAVP